MWDKFVKKIVLIAKDKRLRNKILFILGILLVFRLLAVIPIPGVDQFELERFFGNNSFFGLLNIFSGGGLSALSVVMLGVGPYITASIIMQLMTVMVPKLKELYHEEGEAGRRRFTQYSRLLTIPFAVLQALSLLLLLQQQGVIDPMSVFALTTNIIVITSGSILLMWLGELINEFGLGNGVSIIIFAGIVAGFPTGVRQFLFSYDASQVVTTVAFISIAIIVTFLVVVITEAERPLPIAYSKTSRGGGRGISTYLPLRINQAGVMPVIFALSILLLPQMVFGFLSTSNSTTLQNIASSINTFLANKLHYGILYFFLVVIFTYFYTAVTFDPKAISENLQRSGAFIPGIRPGDSTNRYIGRVVTRITLVGALFLGCVAIIPIIVQGLTGITALTIGGTSLLIVVSVVIDLIKKTEGQITMREY